MAKISHGHSNFCTLIVKTPPALYMEMFIYLGLLLWIVFDSLPLCYCMCKCKIFVRCWLVVIWKCFMWTYWLSSSLSMGEYLLYLWNWQKKSYWNNNVVICVVSLCVSHSWYCYKVALLLMLTIVYDHLF